MIKTGLFDMDGTLFDYDAQIEKDLRSLMSPGETYEEIYDDTTPHIKARLDLIKSRPGWWRDLKQLELGWNVYYLALKIGFDIEIITKGPTSKRQAWAEKAECIDYHFGSNVTVNILGRNKSRYYGHFLCEDYTPYLEGWLEHRPRGLGILISNKRNVGYTHPNVIRYDGTNLADVEKHLLAVFKRKDGEHWKEYL